MARSPRITNPSEPTVYHLMSRTTLLGFPITDVEKDYFVELLRKFSRIYFTEVLGYCCMGNHFHLLVRMFPDTDYSDEDIRERFTYCYGRQRKLLDGQIPYYRERWSNLSKFMHEIKLRFTRFFNKRHDHQGYFWGERFKSVIVEDGRALLNCLAYIDLNPIRAGLVERPEDYRWSSIGWHVQTGNKDRFLSANFGQDDDGELDAAEIFSRYRAFLYQVGAIDTGKGAKIKEKYIARPEGVITELSSLDRFRYRTKYFTDSGIIGSKKFVSQLYHAIRHKLPTKREKIPQEIKGLNGIFSLKKFAHEDDFKSI